MSKKSWTFQLDGEDQTIEVVWSPFWGSGSVYLDGEKISGWPPPVVFRKHLFRIGSYDAEIRRTDGRGFGDPVKDIDLLVEGRHIKELPLPQGLTDNKVQSSHQDTCPECKGKAVILVYENGDVEVVCKKCGRFSLD
jgi:hypothetical protein